MNDTKYQLKNIIQVYNEEELMNKLNNHENIDDIGLLKESSLIQEPKINPFIDCKFIPISNDITRENLITKESKKQDIYDEFLVLYKLNMSKYEFSIKHADSIIKYLERGGKIIGKDRWARLYNNWIRNCELAINNAVGKSDLKTAQKYLDKCIRFYDNELKDCDKQYLSWPWKICENTCIYDNFKTEIASRRIIEPLYNSIKKYHRLIKNLLKKIIEVQNE